MVHFDTMNAAEVADFAKAQIDGNYGLVSDAETALRLIITLAKLLADLEAAQPLSPLTPET